MSDQPAPPKPASPPPSAPAAGSGKPPPPKPPKPSPPRRGGVLALIALILALVALAGVVFGGWQWWQGRQARQASVQATARLEQQVASMQSALGQSAARQQQEQQAVHAANQAFDQRIGSLVERTDGLESAVAGLARHSQQGRRAMLLDQTEMLLRMGQERYKLFHDAAGALKAVSLADQTLAAVDDPAFAGVRHTLAAEQKALAATHPAARANDLATLAHLRAAITQLPLKSQDVDRGKAPQGFWQRVWHAVSTAVVVRRVNGSPQSLADARLTRELAALDVAQAEAARLAWDNQAFHAALEHVDHALATAFDEHDAGVHKARATVKQLLAEPLGTAPVGLGRALQQLRDERAVRGLQSPDGMPAVPASAPPPASATSSAASEPA